MKSSLLHSHASKSRAPFRHPLICAASIAVFAATAYAQTITKANNAANLDLSTSWLGGMVPGAFDIALWDRTVTAANTVALGSDLSWDGIRILDPAGPVTINSGNVLTLGTNGIDLLDATQDLTLKNAIILGVAQNWAVGNGRTLTASGVIDGLGIGVTKTGAGTLTLSGTNIYTGPTAINRGTIQLDFAAAGAPAADIISNSSVLQMAGGTLTITGAAGGTNSQTFLSTTFSAGLNNIAVNPGVGGTAILALNSFTNPLNTTVRFSGTGTITGSTTATTTGGLLGIQSGAGGVNFASAGYATYGLDDFAALSSGNIVPGSTVAGFYTNSAPATGTSIGNFDMIANTTLANGGAQRAANVVRFNTPTATTLTSGTGNLVTFTAALITPNMGANNASLSGGGTWQVIRSTNPNGAQQGTIWQNNTLGFYTVTVPIIDGREGTSDPSHVVKAGAGTAVFSGTNTYTGRTSLYEGALMVTANNNLGATNTPITFNGGTLFGNATFTVAATRAITLNNSGGLAASTGNIMTVGSAISGGGELVIGAGTLAGTGDGTANPTAIVGNGKVDLSAFNSYSGGTTVNGGTLSINGIDAIGGASYGGLTLNGGALQYSPTLVSGSDLTIGKGVVLKAGGGTIDTNGNSVSFANGLVGTGGLTKTGNGTLTLNAAGTYAGNTVVNGGTLNVASPLGSATSAGTITMNSLGTLAGTGTLGGAVTINAGGTLAPGNGVGTLTLPGLTLSTDSLLKFEFSATPANDQVFVTGANGLTINGGKFSFFADGTTNPWSTAGTYNLLSFNGAVQGAGTSTLSVLNPAAGYNYVFGTSGTFVTLTVTASGLITNWAQANGGSWSTGGNWNNGVPNAIGATAGFGSAITGPATVTLDGGKTVSGITFDNANSYTIASGTGGSLTFQKASGSAAVMVLNGSHTISAPVVLASNVAADVSTNSSLTISGQISGAQSITKRGAGVLVLNAANSYSGGTTLETGTVELGNAAALGSAPLGVTGDATVRAGVDGLAPASNVVLSNGVTATVDTQAHTFTLAGTISDAGANGALTKTGSGTLVLAGANTYGGATTVDAGTLAVSALVDGGAPSNLGQSSAAASNLVLNGATLRYTGSGTTTDRLITVGIAGATLDASGTAAVSFTNPGALVLAGADTARTLTLDGTNTDANTLTPIVANNGTGVTSLTKTGAGTWHLSGTNTFTGPTVIAGGTLALGNSLALQNSTLDYSSYGGALSFDALPAATLGGLQGVQNLALANTFLGPVALTVGGNNANTSYFGVLSDAGSLIKAGNGILTLVGVNTFTGSTTISSGALMLAATDALRGTSQIFVNVGGGLRLGNGVTISSPITAAAGAGEFVDVPEAGASATLGGTVTQATGSNQYRLGISGSGATLTITGTHNVGNITSISFITRGNIVFAGNGSLNINTANDTFQFGRFGGQALNLLLKDNASITTGAIGFGGGQAGGAVTLTLQDNASVTASLGKNFDFHGINANVPVTINLNGGAITAGSFTKFQTVAGRETFLNLNGGTIRAGATNANFLPALTGLIANVQTGGAKFDTNGFDVIVTQPLTHDPALDVTPDGGLTKLGVGTLTIAAANTYTGATTVTAGTLEFTTSQTLTSLVIAADAEVRLAPSAPGALPDFSTTASADDEQSAFDGPSQSLAAGGSVQAVPEPGALGLLIIGALSLLGHRRAMR